jgi:hypothetical protein
LNRSRKLFVVEEIIERHLRFALVLALKPLVEFTEFATLGIFLDGPIPFAGMALAQVPDKFEKLLARQLRNRLFDILQFRHA